MYDGSLEFTLCHTFEPSLGVMAIDLTTACLSELSHYIAVFATDSSC